MSSSDAYATGFDKETGKSIDADECPECSGDLATGGGETRCTACGLIVGAYRIHHEPEWTKREEDGRIPRRTGPRTI